MQGMSLLVVVVLNLLAVQYGYGYALRHGANAATSLRSRVSIKPLMAAEEEIPPLNQTAPLKLLCLVEPTPFNYISGYANRFQEAFKFMHKAGDEVKILTADQDPNPPTKFLDYTIDNNFGFRMPMYKAVVLSFDTKLETRRLIREMQPDILHVTSPSAFIWAAAFWSWRYKLPLIMSYHTNLRAYGTAYLPVPGIEKFADFLVWLLHSRADMTITTSDILKEQLDSIPIPNVRVWKKGINTEVFHPKFKNADMKVKLSDGHPEAPLLIYVGRLGFEKQLHKLKRVLDENPGARLALVGKGPADESLKEMYKDYPVHFAGQMSGESLSQAFASADIFVMPSDSETLGFVVLEGMASGLPVVGVAAGGLMDILEDENNGFLVPNNDDMKLFSEKTKVLIEDLEVRQKIGAQARTYAEGLSWEAATSKLRNMQYRECIDIANKKWAAIDADEIKGDKILEKAANIFRPDLAL